MIAKIRAFVTRKSVALTGTTAGAATAHFCVHPCPEHAAVGLLAILASLFITRPKRD